MSEFKKTLTYDQIEAMVKIFPVVDDGVVRKLGGLLVDDQLKAEGTKARLSWERVHDVIRKKDIQALALGILDPALPAALTALLTKVSEAPNVNSLAVYALIDFAILYFLNHTFLTGPIRQSVIAERTKFITKEIPDLLGFVKRGTK